MSSEPDAQVVADAVLEVPGVSTLHAGALGDLATFLPGGRVTGVRLHENAAEVHIVVAPDAPVLDTATAVRTRVEELVTGPVVVAVEDEGSAS